AVAADELRAAVPSGTVDTLAQLAYALRPTADKTQIPLPVWADQINDGTLVVIDEAGMAATTELADVLDFVIDRGGSVRLIGDNRQLSAVGAGGVLRDVQEAAGAATLAELMRFVDPAEAAATLAVRDGDAAAVGFYLDHGRVHDTGDPEESIVDAWSADVADGRSALMIASTREAAAALNEKARQRRIAEGFLDAAGPSVALRSGLPASVGDQVLTRRNDRRNRLGATDVVKNGDRWTVLQVGRTGALRLQHHGSGKNTWIRAEYVQQHVDHAYAVTVHSAQGSTVDVSRVLLDGTEDRQLAYVALSRGRVGNHVYLRTGGDGDPHNVIRPEIVRPSTGAEMLASILERDGVQESASTTRRLAASPQQLLRQHALRYLDGVYAAAEDVAGVEQLQLIDEQAENVQPGVTDCGGWPQLRMMLATLYVAGQDPISALREVRDSRPLGDARDTAAVLAWRLDDTSLFGGDGPLPWLRAIPEPLQQHPTWGPYLGARAELVTYYAAEVRDQATLTVQPPRWAEPISQDQALWRDLAVWRSANEIPDTDAIPAGAALPPSRERNYQTRLQHRVDAVAGPPSPLPAAALQLLGEREPAVLDDPLWTVLVRRLAAAAQRGTDIEAILATALDQGRLPDERPAAALWFRLAGKLRLTTADVDRDIRLRPAWTDDLLQRLPEHVGQRILISPDWPQLVATVTDSVTHTGVSTADLLDHAIGTLNLADQDAGGLPAEAVPAMLIARLEELSTTPGHDGDEIPPDPYDLDASRPDDLDEVYPAAAPDLSGGIEPAGQAEPADDLDEPEPEPDQLGEEEDGEQLGGATRPRLIELNEAAAAWWANHYVDSPAARYIASRLGDDLTDSDITVGYAPPGWTNLVDHLKATGASDVELVDAGLARWSRRGTLIDVMRDRVVFGIRDHDGALVGFTGRAAPGDPDAPKWLNTPSTTIFTKGELLFGLAENRDRLSTGATPVRVEGVMDALAVTIASGGRAVGLAPLGTALTAIQADALAHAAPQQIVLHAADTDRAGLNAAAKDYWLLTSRGVDVRRLILTDGQQTFNDPADAYSANQAGLAAALSATAVAPPLASHLIADLVSTNADVLHTGHVHAVVGMAQKLGPIIAAAPPDQRFDLISAAASMLADATNDDPDHYLELLTATTDEAAQSWTQQPPTTLKDRLRVTAATVQAARQHTTPRPEAAAAGAHYERHRSQDHSKEQDPEHEISP
ncbi:MAG TPA: AAA family ATPase, partial [Microlunatus sp.]